MLMMVYSLTVRQYQDSLMLQMLHGKFAEGGEGSFEF